MSMFRSRAVFSVILSVAKDLIAGCHGHEILRYAQDDRLGRLAVT